MNGLAGLDAGPDWRGPIADRMLISSADGGNAISDAVRQACYLADLGVHWPAATGLAAPKGGARFHFSLPGSRQGFRPRRAGAAVSVGNAAFEGGRALEIGYAALGPGQVAAVTTPTFAPPEVVDMRTYELMATPLVYPGQVVKARVVAAEGNRGAVEVRLRLRVYDGQRPAPRRRWRRRPTLRPGTEAVLEWRCRSSAASRSPRSASRSPAPAGGPTAGCCSTTCAGTARPSLVLRRPEGGGDFWRRAWVNGVDLFPQRPGPSFRISQSRGEGLISHGTRQWTDYEVRSDIVIHLGNYGGVALRVQGLRRYYGVRLTREGRLQIVRVRDDATSVLAETDFPLEFETTLAIAARVHGNAITATVNGVAIGAEDRDAYALGDGGIGLFVHEGALSADVVRVAG